jgi:hypothetical protein
MAHTLRTRLLTPSALRSGALTGVAQIVVALSAAGAGALLAQKFGRTAETDGFLSAYGVYLVLVLAAQTLRLVVVPDLTRARSEDRLAEEVDAYGVAFLAFAVPASLLVALLSRPLGDAITGSLPPVSAHVAGRALAILVPAAFLQLLAALAASALAAQDSYGTAALGYATGGIVGLVVFAAFADSHGIVALAWGLAANGAVSLGVPAAKLLRRGLIGRRLPPSLGVLARLRHLLEGAAVPLALQGCYLLSLRFAAKLGVGSVTTFSYAYLAAALGFLSCIPLGLGLRALWGLPGIAIAVGLSTLLIALGLLRAIASRSLAIAAVGLARLALAVGGAAALAFGGLALALSPVLAAVAGVVVYGLVIVALRSLGLSEAWAYVRGLH